jgi:sec-independent protein translocase protein TatA
MLGLGAPEIIVIVIAILLLFGYKKLPDASRSMGRSLRIFKSEMKGMKEDDVRGKDEARTTPVTGQVVTPSPSPTVFPAAVDYEAEARAAEVHAAEARARAEQARAAAADNRL